jgi:uncharacterized protein DUF4157
MTRRMRVGFWIGLCGAAAVALAQDQSARAPSPVVESLAPVLASWIESERDAAKAQGVAAIPPAIRTALEGYVPKSVLDRVRWRQGASELSLSQNMIRFGHASAVTLDDVIVFEEGSTALEDPKFWAHEIKHVMQFEEWGVEGFATRYLSDSQAVENEASEYRWQFMKHAGLVPAVPSPQP